MEITNKTAVITGSAGGLGKEMAIHFAKLGANIVLSDISADKLAVAKTEIEAIGAKVIAVPTDVSKEKDAIELMEKAVSAFGSVDIAVLNAGILRDGLLIKADKQTGKVASKMSLAEWQAVIDVNLTGVFLTGREAAVQMVNNGTKGVIIPIASVSMHGNPGQTNYSAAKAGVAAMTRLWAKELSRYGIRVAGIAPGFIATEMVMKDMNPEALKKWESQIPIGRLGRPDEIANTAVFIAQNDLVDGVVLEISGGVKI
ncbi:MULTISPECIES: SDR family NAD(P)-dependent oxidoreductase [unclassified Leptospira]|uniref:SDR family oxidoreductase n=1 Tax=unclassified Leptospira TaxID=2633828 RepID=UPI0002BDD90C|nr:MULTISPECIES: SDR family NAD(P)-dependent oxidoreductase [unclassified Leptospira]EMJ96989.1 KR domain protein [Leptospira sp. B5-022]MCR1794538.1 SDR family oxidoreductase [Leptospira sp. id769339]